MKHKRMIRPWIALLLLCFIFSNYAPAAAVAKKELKLKDQAFTIYEGNTRIVRIAQNTTGAKPVYSSNNPSVATVSAKGMVTGLQEGDAVITVKAGSFTANCKVTVEVRNIDITAVSFDYDEITLDIKQTGMNKAICEPSYSNDKNLTYSSSNPAVVSVDSGTGIITGIKEGSATISVTTSKGLTAGYSVYVTGNIYTGKSLTMDLMERDTTLTVSQGTVNIGDSVTDLVKRFGTPNRIDNNEFGGQTYIYNSQYTSLLFIYVRGAKVAGYYTNAATFSCAGVGNASVQSEVENVFGDSYLNVPGRYSIKVWYDTQNANQAIAVFLTDASINQESGAGSNLLSSYDRTLANTMESECFDMLNSFRVRFGLKPLVLIPLASVSSRAHSAEMISYNYASLNSYGGMTPSQRLENSGVKFNDMKEIIIGCRPSGIVNDFSIFLDSDLQRKIIMNSGMYYTGIGISYSNSNYTIYNSSSIKGYITIDVFN